MELYLRDYSDMSNPHPSFIPRQKNIPLRKIIALRKKGLSVNEVANALGCTPQNIMDRLKSEGLDKFDPSIVESYRKAEADILAFQEARLLSGLTDEKIEKAGLKDTAIAFGVMFDKRRLSEGKSTANIATYAFIRKQQGDGESELKAIEAEIVSRESVA